MSHLLVADVSFVTELANAGCITWSQREHLNNILQPRDRNVKLIEFLTRRSVAHFTKFINVLAKEQSHLVPVFLKDGGEIFYFMLVFSGRLSFRYCGDGHNYLCIILAGFGVL